jgi:poly(hydroxyalkanoate) granule-associated protein
MMQRDSKSGHERTLCDELAEAGRNVWLASIGVVALVGKEGRNAFEMLVEKGKAVETRGKTKVDRMLHDAAGQVRAIGKRVESGVQDTSQIVLQRLGVPSHAEINALITRVEQLTAKVEAISRKESVDEEV